MSTTSYWLDEPAEPRATARLDGNADVAVVGGGVTGCSCALALAEAGLKVSLFEAREIAGGASGRNGGFALRGGAAPYPVTGRVDRRRGRRRPVALDGGGARPARSARRRCVSADGQPPARRRRGGARRAARASTTRCVPPGSPRSGGRVSRQPLEGAIRLRSSTRRTVCCSRHAGCAASPSSPRRGRRRDPASTRASQSLDDVDCRHRRRRDRRLPERAARRARGADRPDARPGDRDGADRRALLRDARITAGTASITGTSARRPHRGRWLPRRLARHASSRRTRSRHRPSRQRSSASSTSRSARPLRVDYRWAGIFGMVLRLPPGRRARSGLTSASGWPAATRATATCSASRAGAWWREQSWVSRIRSSSSSSRRGYSSTSAAPSPRRRSRSP